MLKASSFGQNYKKRLGGMNDINEKYLRELSKKFPDKESILEEITKLNIELNLPKGTEHFLSDLHGEADAFEHIMRSASGVIKNKIDLLFKNDTEDEERERLASLIYYPEENLALLKKHDPSYSENIAKSAKRMIKILRVVGEKYSREYINKRLVGADTAYTATIQGLLWGHSSKNEAYYENTAIQTFQRTGELEGLIISLSKAIRALAVDRIHIVGDIFDRGPRADLIIEELIRFDSVDIEWGNHDALWMGASAGSEVCIATVLNNSMTYKNLDVIEFGYGISLRPLAIFAEEKYGNSKIDAFLPKGGAGGNRFERGNEETVARMHKAIALIQFKLECLTIERNPSFEMEDRMLLAKVNNDGRVDINGQSYTIKDEDFTVQSYELTEKEKSLMLYLKEAFQRSEKLQRHIRFLYEKGSMYRISNGNLLFHGCIPLKNDGDFLKLSATDGASGKELMDICDRRAREGYYSANEEVKRQGEDFLWFLWCGRNSPLSAREKTATFERLLIDEKETHTEPKNAYYRVWDDSSIAEKILTEFGLQGASSRIINGHIPVNRGESPIKADGKVLLIDGGFCSAYHSLTGIAGYTLIYNAVGMKLFAHKAFRGKEEILNGIFPEPSSEIILDKRAKKIKIRDVDRGRKIRGELCDLLVLLEKYKSGNSE